MNFPLIIQALSADKDPRVRYALAENPAMGARPEWMHKLANSGDPWVRASLAENPAIADFPEVVATLSLDKNPRTLRNIAKNPALADAGYADIIYALCGNNKGDAARVLAKHPAIINYPEIVEALSTDPDPEVRESLASNLSVHAASTNSWQVAQPVTQAPTI